LNLEYIICDYDRNGRSRRKGGSGGRHGLGQTAQ